MKNEDELLASCYRTALDLAAPTWLASIAFPAISTGIYRFPADRAARIAVGTVTAESGVVAAQPEKRSVLLVSPEAADHHIEAFADLSLGVNPKKALESFAMLLCSIGATKFFKLPYIMEAV